jgi:thiol:disulfide interchange protein DsbD
MPDKIGIIGNTQGVNASNGVCYPPLEKTMDITMPKASEVVVTKSTEVPLASISSTVDNESLNETDQITALLQQDNIWLVLASFFGFGLLLALTPCVFPMIPILSGIIVGQKGTGG